MSQYTANLNWMRQANEAFTDNAYSRRHAIDFDNGQTIAASSSPHVVPLPMSDASAVDPEELFVASLASCHMLWFLGIAAKKRYCVDAYRDQALGVMSKNAQGKLAMTHVTLRPHVQFSGAQIPTPEQVEQLHHLAHEACFIANSVTTQVTIEPIFNA
jgi:organic hydroperoxide reductase OsmC/OhrA